MRRDHGMPVMAGILLQAGGSPPLRAAGIP
jgi:hypothetical protein